MTIRAKSLTAIQTLRNDDERYGLSMAVLSIPLMASLPVLGSMGSRTVAPAIFAALVSIIGTLFMASITWKEIRQQWNLTLRTQKIKLLGVGLFGTGLAYFLLFMGLSLTTGANASILLQTEPVYALILTFFVFGERPSKKQLLATALIMAGAVTVLSHSAFSVSMGDLLVLTVPLCLVISNMIAQSCMRQGVSPQVVLTFRTFWGGIFQALIVISSGSWHNIPWSSSLFLTSVITLGLCATLSSLLWYTAIARVSLSRCTGIISGYPVLAVISSWLFLAETPQWTQVAGLALVLTGIYKMCQRTSPAIPDPEAAVD